MELIWHICGAIILLALAVAVAGGAGMIVITLIEAWKDFKEDYFDK